jgi:carboxyl-terminal processing protease
MKRKLTITGCVLLAIGLLSFTPPAERYFEIAKSLDIFATLFKEVNALYVDEVNPNKLMRVGIDAMLNSLDPYTNFISEDEVEDYKTLHTGEYGGIGALTTEFDHRTVVTMVYKDYPAFENGLKIGDEILKVNGQDISKLSDDGIKALMSGQEGTIIKLAVKRFGHDNPIDLEFKRETIKRSNVPYFGMVNQEVGYIQLTEFTREAAREVKNAIVSLKEQGAKSLVLDLRGNPGGLLEEAVNICNLFIPKGKKVVTMKGKVQENNRTYETLNVPVDTEIPLAIIISRGSASASEIVAGTIQDYDRGIVVGEKSFGKGLVQAPKLLSYNSQIKITIAKYYTPTGRCIQVLDYTHRKEDGSVGSVPDSLKKEFKTTHNRAVFDGGGIDPDTQVKSDEPAAITQVIHSKGFIFDYASRYAFNHPSISAAKVFAMTDQEYVDFVNWMKDKNYYYQSAVESQLTSLVEEAKKERYYNDLKPQLDQINLRLTEGRKNDLMAFKDQIKLLLEKEIASRYYLERGLVEAGFKYDDELKKSMEVLNDPAVYKKTLNLP